MKTPALPHPDCRVYEIHQRPTYIALELSARRVLERMSTLCRSVEFVVCRLPSSFVVEPASTDYADFVGHDDVSARWNSCRDLLPVINGERDVFFG